MSISRMVSPPPPTPAPGTAIKMMGCRVVMGSSGTSTSGSLRGDRRLPGWLQPHAPAGVGGGFHDAADRTMLSHSLFDGMHHL
jgi:hypothetical protein